MHTRSHNIALLFTSQLSKLSIIYHLMVVCSKHNLYSFFRKLLKKEIEINVRGICVAEKPLKQIKTNQINFL